MENTFAIRWARKEQELGFSSIAARLISYGSDFLPDSAAPCLTFKEACHPIGVTEAYGSPLDWSDQDRQRLSNYKMIGSDGAGNPICVDQTSGIVVLLDHEDRFRSCQYINTSARQLGECLLAYMGENNPEQFRSNLNTIDPPALAEKSFWWYQAIDLVTDV